jgi:hypothetical protein
LFGIISFHTARSLPPTHRDRVWLERRLLILNAAFGVAAFLGLAAMQVAQPRWFGDIGMEQAVAEALAFWRGMPLYPRADSPFRYASIYGPALHVLNGLALKVTKGWLTAPILVGVACSSTAFALTFLAAQPVLGRRRALLFTGVIAALGVRLLGWKLVGPGGDALLFCLLTMAHFSARTPGVASALGVGACVAAMVLVKIPAGAYAAVAIVQVVTGPGARSRLLALIAGAAAVVVAILLMPGFDLGEYTDMMGLLAAPGHRLSRRGTLMNLPAVFAFTILPLCWLCTLLPKAAWRHRGQTRSLLAFAFSLGASLIVTARAGSGPNHLFHLAPAASAIFLRYRESTPADDAADVTPLRAALGVVANTAILVAAASVFVFQTAVYQRAYPVIRASSRELEVIRSRLPGREIAYVMMSGNGYGSQRRDFVTSQLVHGGGPLLFCGTAMADHIRAGLPGLPAATRRYLESHRVALVVNHNFVPFRCPDLYRIGFDDGEIAPLFSREVLHYFDRTYRQRMALQFWDVWDLAENENDGPPGATAHRPERERPQ